MLARNSGFSTGVANMWGSCAAPTPIGGEGEGGSLKFDGGGIKSKHEGSMGEIKMLSQNTCEGVHSIVKFESMQIY